MSVTRRHAALGLALAATGGLVAAQAPAQVAQARDFDVDAGDGWLLASRHGARLRVRGGRQRRQQVGPGEIQRSGDAVRGIGQGTGADAGGQRAQDGRQRDHECGRAADGPPFSPVSMLTHHPTGRA